MSDERRRYFRITETIGLTVQAVGAGKKGTKLGSSFSASAIELIAQHDDKIEHLLSELADENPKVGQLLALLNQKIERVCGQIAIENDLLDRIAHKVQEVNISACGLAFNRDEPMAPGTRLKMELTLYPDDAKLLTDGVVIDCKQLSPETEEYYCRVDFLGMSLPAQESLIQHMVQRQSAQLKSRQNELL